MPPSSSPSAPATGSKPSRLKVSDQASTSATYQIDIVQRVRVTSDGPLESDAIDQIKKKLERSLQRDLSGYSSSDESSSAKISITETSVNPGSRLVTAAARHQPPSQELTSKRAPQRILFYHAHDPYYGFTNFSSDPVEYHGKIYPTSEHLFQSLKFLPHRPELAEHMRTCSKRPRAVFDEAHRFSPEARPDWLKVRIEMMDVALWHKFTQNTHLKDELLSTGDAELVEDSDKDAFWGVGPDGNGGNQLGKALQRLRTKLRDANTANGHSGSKADSSKTMHRQ
ncbi:hypothetical protein EDD17DRAFT_1687056 [Pisolithus thermaeus]|nr:hypothetical protein EDD17DRAFT_1687056 [Pisolithus thermaeus]